MAGPAGGAFSAGEDSCAPALQMVAQTVAELKIVFTIDKLM
jgi:hypothetical protein